jgi:hypothetical protein
MERFVGIARVPAAPERRHRRWPTLIGVMVVVLLSSGGGAWYFLAHRPTVREPTAVDHSVPDRKADPAPLTTAEVFPSEEIPSSLGGGPYRVAKTQAVSDCRTAAGGDVAAALTAAGCTQVVRATLTSPDGSYVITAGIFNLTDAAKAGTAQAEIASAISAKKGRFSGLVGGGPTNIIAVAAANVAWKARGHYLIYCMIARTDGGAIAQGDPSSYTIMSDVVVDYLGGTVVRRREVKSGSMAVGTSTPP